MCVIFYKKFQKYFWGITVSNKAPCVKLGRLRERALRVRT